MLSFSWALHYSCRLSHSLLCCGILWPRHCSVSSVQSKELFLFAVLNICVLFHLLTTHCGRQFSFLYYTPIPFSVLFHLLTTHHGRQSSFLYYTPIPFSVPPYQMQLMMRVTLEVSLLTPIFQHRYGAELNEQEEPGAVQDAPSAPSALLLLPLGWRVALSLCQGWYSSLSWSFFSPFSPRAPLYIPQQAQLLWWHQDTFHVCL